MSSSWRNWVPFGLFSEKPRHYREMMRVAWENRDRLAYALRILRFGVCDGCSLGPRGLKDDVVPGVHLCLTRLNLLRLNTMGPIKPSAWADVDRLRRMSNRQLERLGRVPVPLIRRRGETGFSAITWEEAIKTAADAIQATSPDRLGFFVTSRGLTNEAYYVIQKTARLLGTNNIDLCARLCHAASVYGLKQTLGIGAPTCSLSDFIGTDLLILAGTSLANNQPVAIKYLHHAKKAGTRIVVINPFRESGLERYWIPSITRSALFGTRLMDDFFQVNIGGDLALLHGVIKHLIETDSVDRGFIGAHTSGFDALADSLKTWTWSDIERSSGILEREIRRLGDLFAGARSAVFCYSMGLTQHEFGVQNVKAVVNLMLARGMIGRPKCGIMPIRGHSGVQGGGECGVDPDKFCGGFSVNEENARRFSQLWGAPVPASPGLKTADMIDAAANRRLDVLYNVGGNLLETMPDPSHIRSAMSRIKLRIHQDIVLNTSTLLDSDVTLVLPAQTRYESPGGCTSTNTERRIRFSPEIKGWRIADARPEWEIPMLIGRAVLGHAAARCWPHQTAADIRQEMSQAMPLYVGIDQLTREGQHLQWGGKLLFEGGVFDAMPDRRALFTPLAMPTRALSDHQFYLTTRRGKQFNSMTHHHRDRLTGARSRDDIWMAGEDIIRLGLSEGDRIRLINQTGSYEGTCRIGPIKRGFIQVHWPEGNVLLARRYDPVSGEPDYNAAVAVERANR